MFLDWLVFSRLFQTKANIYILIVHNYVLLVHNMILTNNERRLLRFLASARDDYSINELSRECKLTPKGAYKILKKFESEGIVKPKAISNIISYKLDFSNIKTARILELVFISDKLDGICSP